MDIIGFLISFNSAYVSREKFVALKFFQDNSEDEWGRIQKEENLNRKISADDFHISSQSSQGSQNSTDSESQQEPPLALQYGHHDQPSDHGEQSYGYQGDENDRQEYQLDEGNDEMIELQLIGNNENGNTEHSKSRRANDEETEPATQEQIETEWQDVEIQELTKGLEYVRKAGGNLGLYGLSEKQAKVIREKFIPTKTIKQIKRNWSYNMLGIKNDREQS